LTEADDHFRKFHACSDQGFECFDGIHDFRVGVSFGGQIPLLMYDRMFCRVARTSTTVSVVRVQSFFNFTIQLVLPGSSLTRPERR